MKMIWCGLEIKENCHVLVNQFHRNFRSKTLSCRKIKSVSRYVKWCFNASWGLKGLNASLYRWMYQLNALSVHCLPAHKTISSVMFVRSIRHILCMSWIGSLFYHIMLCWSSMALACDVPCSVRPSWQRHYTPVMWHNAQSTLGVTTIGAVRRCASVHFVRI